MYPKNLMLAEISKESIEAVNFLNRNSFIMNLLSEHEAAFFGVLSPIRAGLYDLRDDQQIYLSKENKQRAARASLAKVIDSIDSIHANASVNHYRLDRLNRDIRSALFPFKLKLPCLSDLDPVERAFEMRRIVLGLASERLVEVGPTSLIGGFSKEGRIENAVEAHIGNLLGIIDFNSFISSASVHQYIFIFNDLDLETYRTLNGIGKKFRRNAQFVFLTEKDILAYSSFGLDFSRVPQKGEIFYSPFGDAISIPIINDSESLTRMLYHSSRFLPALRGMVQQKNNLKHSYDYSSWRTLNINKSQIGQALTQYRENSLMSLEDYITQSGFEWIEQLEGEQRTQEEFQDALIDGNIWIAGQIKDHVIGEIDKDSYLGRSYNVAIKSNREII